jgi:hypothetical protein
VHSGAGGPSLEDMELALLLSSIGRAAAVELSEAAAAGDKSAARLLRLSRKYSTRGGPTARLVGAATVGGGSDNEDDDVEEGDNSVQTQQPDGSPLKGRAAVSAAHIPAMVALLLRIHFSLPLPPAISWAEDRRRSTTPDGPAVVRRKHVVPRLQRLSGVAQHIAKRLVTVALSLRALRPGGALREALEAALGEIGGGGGSNVAARSAPGAYKKSS